MSLQKAASKIDIDEDILSQFLEGKIRMTERLAELLEKVASFSKETWLSYQEAYDKANKK